MKRTVGSEVILPSLRPQSRVNLIFRSSGRLPVHLDARLVFPNPAGAPAVGRWKDLVAVGGDLSVDRLLLAYRSGIFPWTIDPISWWSPDPRGIIELENFHAPHSLEKLVRKKVFKVTINQAFHEVMEGCAAPARGRAHTWISSEFIAAYTELHRLGHAHSVECWHDGELAGGIYGVAIGGLFAGESMFHRVSNASKVALFSLVQRLRLRGFALFDIQMVTPATAQLGAREIPRAEDLERLRRAVKLPCRFG